MNQKFNEIIFGNMSKIEGDKLFVNESDFEIPHGTDYDIAIKELYEIKVKKGKEHFWKLVKP